MGFGDRSHVKLGDFSYKLDESDIIFNPPYKRWSRSIFLDSSTIIGGPGANLRPDVMVWNQTEFDGEGQVVVDASDPESGRQFYISEGLDFRTPGEFRLNKSVTIQKPVHTGGSGTTTIQGSSFTDVSGTATVDGTDIRLNALTNVVGTANQAIGEGTNQIDFYLYHEPVSLTTIEGSSMDLKAGTGETSGTDHTMRSTDTRVGTVDIGSVSGRMEVNFYAYLSTAAGGTKPTVRCQVVDTTNGAGENAVVVNQGSNEVRVSGTASGKVILTETFLAETAHTYQFRFFLTNLPANYSGFVYVDKVTYGYTLSPKNEVTISVYNVSGSVEVINKVVQVTATAAGALTGSLVFSSAAATNYSYRVAYTLGSQRPYVDKVIATVQTSGSNYIWKAEAIEVGQGGKVWLVGSNASQNVVFWQYDFATEKWANPSAITSTTALVPRAVAHTDKYEYVLLSDKIVYQLAATPSSAAYIAATTADAVGMCIAQDRLFVLGEDATNGVVLYLYAVDATATTPIISTVPVTTAKDSPDTTLRQRMTGSPTGARYFLNFSGEATAIYECDASAASPTNRLLATLPDGVKATAILHTGGVTLIAGQFLAETGKTNRSALWVIDANGILRRVGYLRRDNPNTNYVVAMDAWQDSVWMLQGPYVWRYALTTGGLFCEYEHNPLLASSQRGLAVMEGHTFAAYSGNNEGIHVSGAVGTYRQSSTVGGSQITSSIYDFALPAESKSLYSIDVLTDPLPVDGQVKVEYQLDGSGGWVDAGTVAPTLTSQNLFSARVATVEESYTFPATVAAGERGWVIQGDNSTSARSTATARTGSACAATTSVASGTAILYSELVSIVAGRTYATSAWTKAATAARSVTSYIYWYDRSLNLLSSSAGSSVTNSTTAWTQTTTSGVAPPTAVWGVLLIWFISTGAGGEVHYTDDASFYSDNMGPTKHRFFISTGANTVDFHTLQTRVSLGSGNGTATPVVRAITVRGMPLASEEFLDLRLLLIDEDATFYPANRVMTGGELAANLWALKNTGSLVTLHDGYTSSIPGIYNPYLVRVESIDQTNTSEGEGVAQVRLRVV